MFISPKFDLMWCVFNTLVSFLHSLLLFFFMSAAGNQASPSRASLDSEALADARSSTEEKNETEDDNDDECDEELECDDFPGLHLLIVGARRQTSTLCQIKFRMLSEDNVDKFGELADRYRDEWKTKNALKSALLSALFQRHLRREAALNGKDQVSVTHQHTKSLPEHVRVRGMHEEDAHPDSAQRRDGKPFFVESCV